MKVHMTGKVSGHHCVGCMLNVKNMTLEPVGDSVPGLTYILNAAKLHSKQ